MEDRIRIDNSDAKELTKTIIEVESLKELYDLSKTDINMTKEAVSAVLERYISAVKNHKLEWREILHRYIGEEETQKYYNVLRFDVDLKVIFKIQIEGCPLCK